MFRLRATYFARVVASSQSLLRSHPPDGDFSLRSLAPPIHDEPAALGFDVRRERAKRRLETKVSKTFLWCHREVLPLPPARSIGDWAQTPSAAAGWVGMRCLCFYDLRAGAGGLRGFCALPCS